MIRPLAFAVAAVAGFALAVPTARADSFSFSYSTGGWHGRPWYGPPGHYKHHHRHHHSYYRGSYWGPPAYRPRVVVVTPPPVAYYAPPPPVIYAPAPYGGSQISAVPASPVYQTVTGQYCREYQAGVTVGGAPQRSYGTACLMPDGSWRVVE
ncbi:MAG: hypothetical protein ACK4FK_18390 [Ferrovibrio sp.]|uniref:hypothetical protein n=1 Tax=Ferrovibrio sp. TaxID=1917215 RepID=UPI00391BF1CD